MHSLRRAVLRSAAASASRTATASTATRIAPFAARSTAECNAAKIASPQVVRFFSQTARKAAEDKQLEEAQRRSEEDFERQAAADARQDVEEAIANTEADIQEAMQESSFPSNASQAVKAKPAAGGQESQNTAFVRNIVFELSEEHLTKAFSKYGNVTKVYIARDPRGMSKGYGFVSFETPEELKAACDNVNGSFWHGRRITCIPRATEGRQKQTKHRNSPDHPTQQLFVGNIPYETTDAELNRLFRGMDNLEDVRVAVDRTTGWPRGFAHADFTTVEAAIEAKKKLEGAKLGNRVLRIDFAEGYTRKIGKSRNQSSGRGHEAQNSRL
ncbi:hypothetical protein MYCTH_2296912 [Thermothelomyces thermophilus ATCC 42464]|uniref:RRM domain-containing protein n=1 Tax=Thermothelomyces thermophilus (strain ATCC 42464 / BCRC 31852 / DSM 1799) TaxID=573729 RepID=G2Q3C3_THET4|nr:uncharacterized protein MYCTH_2296912 [Thermothelomyces thermophilus ATCC 42464]AEO54384.1 hypothetical protein MYCTH_2296912 [Thermothelomyces thermophilus ATCC 42464]